MASKAPYILVSVPTEGTKRATFFKIKSLLSPSPQNHYADVTELPIPEFKIGTLDLLVSVSDVLAKVDASMEGMLNKLVDQLKSLYDGDMKKTQKNLLIDDKSVDESLKDFRWNTVKYRTDKTPHDLLEMIQQEVNQIDTMVKNEMKEYNTAKSNLAAIERKSGGNLSVKSFNGLVRKEQFVLNSEHLKTLVIAVPKSSVKDWMANYESLTQMVVPRSSQQIAQDDSYALMTVTLFGRVVDDFIQKAKEKKWIPREFEYNEKSLQEEKISSEAAKGTAKEQYVGQDASLLRVCKTNFGEIFSSWIHIKVVRVFVESVLRYGLPPDFQVVIIKPKKNQDKKVRELLGTTFSKLSDNHYHINNKSNATSNENAMELNGLIGPGEYYPYVSFDVNWQYAEE